MNFLTVMDLNGTAFRDATDANLDVDQWLRSFAVQVLFGIGDSYSSGSTHNAAFYVRPEDNKVLYFPWDMDFTFSSGTNASFTPNGDLSQLIGASPANERAYYGHLYDIVTTTFNTAYMTDWANHYSCFLPTENLASHLPYINSRSAAALSAINAAVPTVPFQISTPNGSSTTTSTITLQGDAWVNVRELRIGNAVLDLTWIDDNTWQVTVPVAPGANSFVINAYDHQGNLISGATDTVSVTGSGSIVPAIAGKLVISEMMYNPAAEVGEDADDYEFIELLNIDPANTLSLGGLQFINGITFTFPAMSLAPGARVIVARKQASFIARYGNGATIAGEYVAADESNKLSNGGERITLVDALGATISDFTFDDTAPWPIDADGVGYSLELVNPESSGTDPILPFAWRTSRTIGGNPGSSDSDDLATWAAANGIVDLSLDPDKDGRNHLAEFVFGTNPFVSDVIEISATVTGGVLSAAVVVRNGADGVLFGAGRSPDLVMWEPATYLGQQNNDDGATSTLFFEATNPSATEREFIRFEMIEE
jgi:hypothetical protein